MLEPAGISADEESVYRALLAAPSSSVRELSANTGIVSENLSRIIGVLESKGLASRTTGRPTRFVPAPPDVAIEALVHRRQAELEETRLAAQRLVEEFRSGLRRAGSEGVVEVITSSDALYERFVQLQRAARHEIMSLDKPPYVCPPGPNETELEILARGVKVRGLYAREALEVPGLPEWMQIHIDAGEEARVLSQVPIKLAIADRKLGLVPLNVGDNRAEGAILIHSSALLDGLIELFESLWRHGVPLPQADGVTDAIEDVAPEDKQLMLLLTSGLSDQAIANQLGISVRTVGRRVGDLMNQLGASTRFQAGAQAARRGRI